MVRATAQRVLVENGRAAGVEAHLRRPGQPDEQHG